MAKAANSKGSGAKTTAPAKKEAPVKAAPQTKASGFINLVRKNPDTGQTENQTMARAAYDNLPEHKYGWGVGKPIEIQSKEPEIDSNDANNTEA